MGGYVYLISDIENNTYKIGVTKNLVNNRLKKLQTGNSNKLELVSSFYFNYPFRLEKMLHNHFKNCRVNGEWFSLTNDEVSNFTYLCMLYSERINSLLDNPFFIKNIR